MRKAKDNNRTLVDLLVEKTEEGSLRWSARSNIPKSFQVELSGYDVHLDYDREGKGLYEIWVFDEKFDLVASFDNGDLENIPDPSDRFTDYSEKLVHLYDYVAEDASASGLDILFKALRQL